MQQVCIWEILNMDLWPLGVKNQEPDNLRTGDGWPIAFMVLLHIMQLYVKY